MIFRHAFMSQWVTSKGECRILGWCQIVLRWSELPITTSARIYASSNSIPFASPTFFSEPMLTIFRLGNMSSFPKILRETRLDEDKVILNRSCYAFRFIPRLLLRSPAFNLWLLQWTSPPRCQQPKKPTSIQEAATSVGQNNWWSQHGDNRFMRYQRQISHTLRSSWWNCQLNHSKIWSLNISPPSYSSLF